MSFLPGTKGQTETLQPAVVSLYQLCSVKDTECVQSMIVFQLSVKEIGFYGLDAVLCASVASTLLCGRDLY